MKSIFGANSDETVKQLQPGNPMRTIDNEQRELILEAKEEIMIDREQDIIAKEEEEVIDVVEPTFKNAAMEEEASKRISMKNIVSFDQTLEQPSIYTLHFSMMISSKCFGIKYQYLFLFYFLMWFVIGLQLYILIAIMRY